MPIPELLAPAGSWQMLETALAYGADAVYLGGPGPNLRAKGSNFSWQQLQQALHTVQARGKRAYVCLNAYPCEPHMSLVHESLERLAAMPADSRPQALIIADPGVLHLAQKLAPHIPLHLSTQANTGNAAALEFWQAQGVRRVNLARELDITAMAAMFASTPAQAGLELEVFVHGAQCMALSGRCLLSAWLNNRSANMGACTHPCRYDYRPLPSLHLEEKLRQGSALWEVEQGADYSEILAAEDLCLLPYLRWLKRAAALKIEGRTKSEGHLAQVLDAYRFALDSLALSDTFDLWRCLDELGHTAKRPLTSGMFLPKGRRRAWLVPETSRMRPVLGKVLQTPAPGRYKVAIRAPWLADKEVEALEPGLKRPVLAADAYSLEDDEGRRLERAHPGLEVWLRCETPLTAGWFLRQVV